MKIKFIKIRQFFSNNGKIIDIILIVSVIILLTIAGVIYFKNKKHPDKDNKQTEASTSPANVNSINDESLGVSFYIDKDFSRLEQKDLQSKNPYFIYGFQAKDVSEVGCYVSQTSRTKSGYVSPEYLKEGTLSEIKKSNPDVELIGWNKVNLGAVEGVKLDMKYKNGDKTIKQVEIVGTTDKLTTFAFCTSPESLYESLYKSKFDIFLNSIKLK